MTSPEELERVGTRAEVKSRRSAARFASVAMILVSLGGTLGYGFAWRAAGESMDLFFWLLLSTLIYGPLLLIGVFSLWLCVPRFTKKGLLVVAGLAVFAGSFQVADNLRWGAEVASLEDYVEESLTEFEGDAAWLQLRLMHKDAPPLVRVAERHPPIYVEIVRDPENFEKAKRVVVHSGSFPTASATFEIKDGKWTRIS